MTSTVWRIRRKPRPFIQALCDASRPLVLFVNDKVADIGFVDGRTGQIPISALQWAREPLEDQKVGASPAAVTQVLGVGDVIYDARGAVDPRPDTSSPVVPYDGGRFHITDPPPPGRHRGT